MSAPYAATRALRVPITAALITAVSARNITSEVGDVTFRHTIPGGFATCTVDLNRPFSDYSDELVQFALLRLTDGRNGGVLWEGRLEDPGRTASAAGQVWSLSALGPMVHAQDDVRPYVAVESSMQSWVPSPHNPKTTTGSTEQVAQDRLPSDPPSTPPTVFFDGLKMSPDQGIALSDGKIVGSFMYPVLYESGQFLGAIQGQFLNGYLGGDIQHQVTLYVGQDDQFTTGALTPSIGFGYNFGGANPPFPVLFLWRKSIEWNSFTGTESVPAITWIRSSGTAQTTGPQHWVGFTCFIRPIMHDKFGTSIPSNSPNAPLTFCTSDQVFADLIGKRLPLFDPATTDIAPGTSGLIDQFSYPDPVTVDQMLTDLMELEKGLYFWAAWESYSQPGFVFPRARAEWSLWPSEIKHIIGMEDGCELPTSTEEVFDSVSVRWKDSTGRTRTTICTLANALLDAAGIRRRGTVDTGENVVSSISSATIFGNGWLTDRAFPRGTGTLSVARSVLDRQTGRMLAPWEVRPGCLIQIAGADPSAYSQGSAARNGRNVFRVVTVEFNSATGAATLELDSPPNSVMDQVATANRNLDYRRRR